MMCEGPGVYDMSIGFLSTFWFDMPSQHGGRQQGHLGELLEYPLRLLLSPRLEGTP